VTGVKEKDITLGVARRLGQLIHADRSDLREVRVVFTRTTDTFVPLYSRGQIANEAGGKLFVSIHCNSTARKPNPQRGFEVYLLRPGRTEEAINIAERENAVIQLEEGYEERYKQLTDENFILVTMAQSAYMRSSELLAGLVQKQMASVAGLLNHGVKQAGFYVLVGAAMPNVLVETAYLSNREDEKFLKSAAGQKKVAEALFRAIRKYKVEYEKLLANE
jgi:N-acetylmuramoyl-L-alanine amidase